MSRVQDRRLLNALGDLTGEGDVVEPLSGNELQLKQTRWIVMGLVVAVLSLIFSIAGYNIHASYSVQHTAEVAMKEGYHQTVLPNGSLGWVK